MYYNIACYAIFDHNYSYVFFSLSGLRKAFEHRGNPCILGILRCGDEEFAGPEGHLGRAENQLAGLVELRAVPRPAAGMRRGRSATARSCNEPWGAVTGNSWDRSWFKSRDFDPG